MGTQAIDLSAGLQPVDLSAGLVPSKTAPPAPAGLLQRWYEQSGLQGIKTVLMQNPVTTVEGALRAAGSVVPDIKAAYELGKQHGFSSDEFRHAAVRAVPVVGGMAATLGQDILDKNYSGAVGDVLGAATSVPLGELAGKLGSKAVKAAAKLPAKAVRGGLLTAADDVAAGSTMTPRQIYQAAKDFGVKLDAADATNSPALKGAKKINENSLLGAHLYENRRAANLDALAQTATDTTTSMSPLDREAGGQFVQEQLRNNRGMLQSEAQAGYDALRDATRNSQVEGLKDVSAAAGDYLRSTDRYNTLFKSLTPRQAVSLAEDLRQMNYRGANVNWGNAQRLRSDLLEMVRSNPDLVKDHAGAFYQRMASSVDTAMEAEAAKLPEELQPLYREANANWAEMKQTFDDPSSPFYHAVRTHTPSTLVSGIGPKVPEMVREVAKRIGEEGLGVMQRGEMERMLGSTSEGLPNFRNFSTQLSRLPEDYRQALFDVKDGKLRNIASVGNVLNRDFNPSGSAKIGQKVAEGAALASGVVHPLPAIAALAQYPLSKLMNSDAFIDWLMKSPKVTQELVKDAARTHKFSYSYPALAKTSVDNQSVQDWMTK